MLTVCKAVCRYCGRKKDELKDENLWGDKKYAWIAWIQAPKMMKAIGVTKTKFIESSSCGDYFSAEVLKVNAECLWIDACAYVHRCTHMYTWFGGFFLC